MTTTTHVSGSDLVDLLDGRGTSLQQAHASVCPTCRARLEALRDTWAVVESDEAAEPSPLFWDHLSERVAEVVRAEAAIGRQWTLWRWGFVAVPAMLVVLAVAAVWRPGPATVAPAEGDLGRGLVSGLALDDDDGSWELVAMLSESLAGEESDSPVFEPRLGAADRALVQLSAVEQEALARLLTEEMRSGPS